jgi:hypothetical protein
VLIEVDGRELASFPPELFGEEILERIRRGDITVELEPSALGGTRAVTFLDSQRRAVFRDRIRVAEGLLGS